MYVCMYMYVCLFIYIYIFLGGMSFHDYRLFCGSQGYWAVDSYLLKTLKTISIRWAVDKPFCKLQVGSGFQRLCRRRGPAWRGIKSRRDFKSEASNSRMLDWNLAIFMFLPDGKSLKILHVSMFLFHPKGKKDIIGGLTNPTQSQFRTITYIVQTSS